MDDSEIEEGHVFRHHDDVETASPEEIDAYDLDADGKISLVEMGRAEIGILDARMEEIAEHMGRDDAASIYEGVAAFYAAMAADHAGKQRYIMRRTLIGPRLRDSSSDLKDPALTIGVGG